MCLCLSCTEKNVGNVWSGYTESVDGYCVAVLNDLWTWYLITQVKVSGSYWECLLGFYELLPLLFQVTQGSKKHKWRGERRGDKTIKDLLRKQWFWEGTETEAGACGIVRDSRMTKEWEESRIDCMASYSKGEQIFECIRPGNTLI